MKPQQSTELYPEVKSDEKKGTPIYQEVSEYIVPSYYTHQISEEITEKKNVDVPEFNPNVEKLKTVPELMAEGSCKRKRILFVCILLASVLCCSVVVMAAISAITVGSTCAAAKHETKEYRADVFGVDILRITGPGDVVLIPSEGPEIVLKIESKWIGTQSYTSRMYKYGNTISIETKGERKFCTREKRIIHVPVRHSRDINLIVDVNGKIVRSGQCPIAKERPGYPPQQEKFAFTSITVTNDSEDILLENDVSRISHCHLKSAYGSVQFKI